MKILFVSDVSLSRPTSGSEQVLNNETVGLSRRGFNVHAITRVNGESKPVEIKDVSGVKEACYYANTKNIGSFLASLFKNPVEIYNKILDKEPFAVAICHQPFTCFSLIIKRKFNGIPIIYTFHSPNHEEYLISRANKRKLITEPIAKLRKMIEGYCVRKSDRIMVLSDYMKKKVAETHRISEKLIVTNPGGVEINRFKPMENRNAIKAELLFPTGDIHLLTIRNLEARMGLDKLIKAIYLIKKQKKKVHLTIGGEGRERKNLENFSKKLGITKQVNFTGFIPLVALPKYYVAGDFFILPTQHLEGFGLVTVESLSCGTPVLGTPVGGTKEILGKFNSDFLFSGTNSEAMAKGIQEAIDNYLNKTKTYSNLRKRCRKFVSQNYSWQRHIYQLESIILELTETDQLKN